MHSWISLGTKFQPKLTILIFWSKFARKGYFRSKTEISEYHHWIMRIWIGLVTEFHSKKQLNAQKGYFCAKNRKKVSFTMEFCILELVYVPSLSVNWQFLCFEPNLPKKGIPSLKQKMWTPPLNSAYLYYSRYQISA